MSCECSGKRRDRQRKKGAPNRARSSPAPPRAKPEQNTGRRPRTGAWLRVLPLTGEPCGSLAVFERKQTDAHASYQIVIREPYRSRHIVFISGKCLLIATSRQQGPTRPNPRSYLRRRNFSICGCRLWQLPTYERCHASPLPVAFSTELNLPITLHVRDTLSTVSDPSVG